MSALLSRMDQEIHADLVRIIIIIDIKFSVSQESCVRLDSACLACVIMAKSIIIVIGVARFIDASIYHDTFPAIMYRDIIFYNHNFFLYNDFHLGTKDS